jgi:hypothetical protein
MVGPRDATVELGSAPTVLTGKRLTYVLQIHFKATYNIAERI